MRLRQLGIVGVTLIVFAAFVLGAGESSAPLGVPADEDVAKAVRLIKQTFAQEYAAATTLPQRSALAQRLLKEAIDTKEDGPNRYALLCESRDLAAKSADAVTACRAIDQLARAYGVASGEMTLAALSNAGRIALTPPSQESLARCALAAADQCLTRDEYDVAGRLASLAEAAAAKTKKLVLVTDVQDKQKEINWASHEFTTAKAALETLVSMPDDPAARAAAGRFKCLVKNDWEHGLPLLLDCADAQLKLLAERDEAAAGASPEVQGKIGDDWWDLGDQYLRRARLACRSRAAYWYKRAAPKLNGLPRTLAQKRLEEVDLARLREMHLEPGLAAEFFEGQTFGKSLAHRVHAQLNFEWPGAPEEGLPKDDFSVRWTGYLRVTAPGRHTFLLHANEGARVYIDGKLVVDEPKGAQKRKATTGTISLTEGVHSFGVEFWEAGGLAKIHLLWQPPGAKTEELIPASAFVHEMGTAN